jgi:hypothetical protein
MLILSSDWEAVRSKVMRSECDLCGGESVCLDGRFKIWYVQRRIFQYHNFMTSESASGQSYVAISSDGLKRG